ncbi:Hypothetical predicted protein [Marmota monax]|uniref:Thymidine kinase n=2 Tax=Marmota monax TaxID=9995 RepID=A0A5E4C572_MARMO|nr:Hypothetical predicted protein [Marmota monax]
MELARGASKGDGGAEALLGELEGLVQDVVRASSWWELHGVDCAILALSLLALPAGFLCLSSENVLVFAIGITILGVCHSTLTVKGSHLATHGALTKSKRWSKIWLLFFVEFPDIVEFCETMANAGKTVIVAALDGTFQRKAFGAILNLVPLAESVVKLTAVCMECFREAAYTKRLGLEKEVEVIGGADKYHSVCRLCYFKKSSVQPAGQDNKENCPALGRAGEAAAVRKLFAPQQVLHCSPTN